MIAGIAMLVATPLGLGAAAYLSEYASPRTRRVLKPILETLARIPSVVLGYFALQWINPALVQKLFASAGTFNFLAAGLAVGILSRSRSSPRWQRTRCMRCRVRCARPRRVWAPKPDDRDDEGGLPFGGLGDRGVVDPGVLPRGRRDDDRGDRGGRRPAGRLLPQPARTRADDDRRDLVARDRLRSGARVGVPRSTACTSSGCCCSCSRSPSTSCPSGSFAVCGGSTDGARPRRREHPRPSGWIGRSRGRKRDLGGLLFQFGLLATLVVALAVLVVLLSTMLVDAVPTSPNAGWTS